MRTSGFLEYGWGYSEYLARDDDGSMISRHAFIELCDALDASDEDVARALGVHVNTVRRWYDGLGLPVPASQDAIRDFMRYGRRRLNFLRERLALATLVGGSHD